MRWEGHACNPDGPASIQNAEGFLRLAVFDQGSSPDLSSAAHTASPKSEVAVEFAMYHSEAII
jgi:hypothetical protein